MCNTLQYTHTHTHTRSLNTLTPHLLFGPELVEHLLDLHAPVVLHAVEGFLGHGGHHRLLDGRQLLQDAGEGGPHVGVLVPALCMEHTRPVYLRVNTD